MVSGNGFWSKPTVVLSPHREWRPGAGLVHARDAIFCISNCKYCNNFTLKTLHARLAVFDRESAVLPCRAAPEASFLHEAAAWSSEAELEAMENEQFSLSLPPSPGRHRANSPVQFSRGCLAPSLEARDAVSFGLEDNAGPSHSTLSRLAARRHGLLRPTLSLLRFWRTPLRSWA